MDTLFEGNSRFIRAFLGRYFDCGQDRYLPLPVYLHAREYSQVNITGSTAFPVPTEESFQDLVEATELQNVESAQEILKNIFHPEDDEMFDFILFIMKLNKYELFSGLLSLNQYILSYKRPEKNTLLHCAASMKNEIAVQIILKHKVDVFAANEKNETALHIAAKTGNIKIIDEILKCVTKFDEIQNITDSGGLSLFHIICMGKNSKYVSHFLQLYPASINDVVRRNCEFFRGYTPLHFAVAYVRCDNVKILVESNADLEAKTFSGQSVLDLVCKPIDLESVVGLVLPCYLFRSFYSIKYIIESIESKLEAFIPSLESMLQDRMDILEILLAKGYVIDAPDKDSGNPLTYVVANDCKLESNLPSNCAALKKQRDSVFENRRSIVKKFVIQEKLCFIEKIIKSYENPLGKKVKTSDLIEEDNFPHKLGFTDLYDTVNVDYNCNRNYETFLKVADLILKCHNVLSFFKYFLYCNLIKIDNRVNIDCQDSFGYTTLHYEFMNKPTNSLLKPYNSNFLVVLEFGADLYIENESNESVISLACRDILKMISNPAFQSTIKLYEFNDIFDLRLLDNVRRENALAYPEERKIDLVYIFRFWNHLMKLKLCKYCDSSSHDLFLTEVSSKIHLNELVESKDKFIASCLQEIDEIKKVRINSVINLQDLLSKSIDKLALYTKNDNLKDIFESSDFDERFPLYGKIMKTRYVRALARAPLIEKATTSFRSLLQLKVPEPVYKKIFSYLSEKKLRDLILSSE